MMRREQDGGTIKEQEHEESHSFINPFSNSEALCNQVLQLAKNVSRFDAPPGQDTPGYSHLNRLKHSADKPERSALSRKSRDKAKIGVSEVRELNLCESQQVSELPLPQPPSILNESS